MGRLILLLFIIVVIVVLWKAFGPGARSGSRGSGLSGFPGSQGGNGWPTNRGVNQHRRPIAPDDDPDFLWKLKKAEFDRRKREQAEQERQAEHKRAEQERRQDNPQQDTHNKPETPDDPEDGPGNGSNTSN